MTLRQKVAQFTTKSVERTVAFRYLPVYAEILYAEIKRLIGL